MCMITLLGEQRRRTECITMGAASQSQVNFARIPGSRVLLVPPTPIASYHYCQDIVHVCGEVTIKLIENICERQIKIEMIQVRQS